MWAKACQLVDGAVDFSGTHRIDRYFQGSASPQVFDYVRKLMVAKKNGG